MNLSQMFDVWVYKQRTNVAQVVQPQSPPIPQTPDAAQVEVAVRKMVLDLYPKYCGFVLDHITKQVTTYLVSGGIEEHDPNKPQ